RLRYLLRGHKAPLNDVEFSRGGRGIVTASVDHDARTWHAATGAPDQVFRGQFGSIAAASFSPDGRWVVTAGPIAAVLWPAETGRLLFYLRGHTKMLTSVSFSPDGRRILSSSLDGTVRVYLCEVCGGLEGLERLARVRLERS